MHVTAVNVSLTTADQFERAVTPVMPSLIGYARRLSKNAADTDDLVQDTLLKAWAARLGFRTGSNVKAWLIRIARNTFLSNLRHAGRQVLWEAEDIARALVSDNDQESALMLGDLANAISRLSAPQRFAFELIVENGLSYEEASKRSGIDIGTIKSQVSRARTRLVQAMDGSLMPRSEVVPVKTVTRANRENLKQTTFDQWKKSGRNLIG